ncbi:MAG: glycosyltransferase family 1 protein [Patescibacteria group bacterium]|nr:glycosyltransferase family 1 protein [Patescibacteria group bacterium]
MLIAFDCRIITDKNPAGVGRVTLELLKKVLVFDKKNEYMLIFSNVEMKDFVTYQIRHIKRKCKVMIVPFGILTWQNLFYFSKILEERNVDIYYQPYYFCSPFYKKFKTVITVHDLIHFFYPKLKTTFSRKLFHYTKIPSKIIFRRVERIITVSVNTSRDLVKMFKISPKKIKLIYNGVSENFKPVDVRRARTFMSEKYNIYKPYILYVGRMEPHKNIRALVVAYAKLPSYLQERYQLVLAGKEDFKYSGPIRDLIDKYGIERRVVFTGYVDESDLPFIYGGAAVFIFPSFYEGFGIPVLEAMSCGIPVVCSDTSSIPEVGGDAALYSNPTDVYKMSENIKNLLEDTVLREEMIRRGLKQAKNFTWFNAANSLIECFNELGNGKNNV